MYNIVTPTRIYNVENVSFTEYGLKFFVGTISIFVPYANVHEVSTEYTELKHDEWMGSDRLVTGAIVN